MIVFAVVHGPDFIRQFFEICLPSLYTPKNLPSIKDEPLELNIFTDRASWPLLQHYLSRELDRKIFGDQIFILTPDIDEDLPTMSTQRRNSRLLFHALDRCIKKDQRFLHASPDQVYADGVVSTCWSLHRMTGKIVAVFNGRVVPPVGKHAFAREELLQAGEAPLGLPDFFFKNLNEDWLENITTDYHTIPGDAQGHLIYQVDGRAYVFCASPNPIIGKFTLDDLFFFVGSRGFRAWDHEWTSQLMKVERLVVQTDLDRGMAIEPEKFRKAADAIRVLQDAHLPVDTMFHAFTGAFAPHDIETYRAHKFATEFSSHCFASSRTIPDSVLQRAKMLTDARRVQVGAQPTRHE